MLKICLGKCALCVILFACCTQLAFAQTSADQPEPVPRQPMIDPEAADRVDEILNPPSFDSRNSPFLSSLLGGQQPRRRGSDRLAKTPAVFGDLYNGTKRYMVNGDDHVGVDLPFTGNRLLVVASV